MGSFGGGDIMTGKETAIRHKIAASQNAPMLYEMATISCLGGIFTYILQKELYNINQAENVSSHRIGQIKAVLEYIELHYSQAVTLEELAAVANMNPKYFCRIFKEITRQTPMDYVISYRIEQAVALLSMTNRSILETAMECGFNDCSYFIRTFKNIKHMTPLQYRKNNAELQTL